MKKVIIFLALVSAGAAFQQCAEEQKNDALGSSKVSFNINLVSSDNATPAASNAIAVVGVVLERPNGTVALQKDLKISSQQDFISTEPIELVQGEYRIREFMARDVNGNVVYRLQINHPTSCEGDKNLLKTFYAGANGTKSVSLVLHAAERSQAGS